MNAMGKAKEALEEAKRFLIAYRLNTGCYSEPAWIAVNEALSALEAEKPAEDDDLETCAVKILECLYSCGRVWSAWQVGTMQEDDFICATEDESIMSDALAHIKAFAKSYHASECAKCKGKV